VVTITLDIDRALGRRAGLEDALRRAVLSAQLTAGTAVPSTRGLARELGIARATVVGAYEQLIAEGYLLARQGAGTVVAPVHVSAGEPADRPPRRPPHLIDLLPGEPDHGSFPRAQWVATLRRVLSSSPDDVFGYGDHRGLYALRSALAGYLARSRVVIADPARIVVFGGYASALSTLAEALHRLGVGRIAMEDPCLPPHARAVAAVGPEVVPIGVDRDGLRVQDLDGEGAVVCTPTHQYPIGVALSPSRRLDLATWARDRGSWVVEDDYDGEFRYDRPPVGALHGLAPERVVYAGTASKSLAPGLGVAWLVLPPALVEPVLETKRLRRGAISTIEQAALADFIVSGRLDRHVRKMRTVYRRRRDEMLRVLAPHFEVIGLSAGLHLTALTEREVELVERARARSIALFGIGDHVIGEQTMRGLVVGYSRSPGHAYAGTLERLDAFLHARSSVQ
jgi:GntR family transcriptional regulator/MocR family aminotransferase